MFKSSKDLVAPIFLQITHAMLDGSDFPPPDFNWAFLVCLAKGSGTTQLDGTLAHDSKDTRPLSIVDSSNRILASIFRVALERCLGSWVSEFQRGFLGGRQMLRNVLDIDFAAHKISVRSSSGAILLFDFAAAFPSMSHDFMWDVLSTIGLPDHYIDMLKLFYKGNEHFIRIGGAVMDSITVYSGVRQGCPLSPLLFALCADILLRALAEHLQGDDALRAFADDTAVVVAD